MSVGPGNELHPRYVPRPRGDWGRRRSEPDADDERLRALASFLARSLVDCPEEVQVRFLGTGQSTDLELNVHQDDLAHVIGRQGRTARSMRLVLSAAAARVGRRATLEIAD